MATGVTIWVIENITSGLYVITRFTCYLRTFSALYVIDLVRFRQMAAGDRLRGQYQVITVTIYVVFNLLVVDAQPRPQQPVEP